MTTHLSPTSPATSRHGLRTTRRSRLETVTALLVAAGLVGAGWLAVRPEGRGGEPGLLPTSTGNTHADGGGPGAGDGHLPDSGVTIDDTHLEAVARLDPDLQEALRRATAAAADEGIEVRITSGWRSPDYQQHLLDQAAATHGEREARKLVQTPDRSRHVTGDAVDVGPTDAAFWMLHHGSAFGLCQVYANEVWHYELQVEPGGTCPPLLPDAS